jgi:hypothetical protein
MIQRMADKIRLFKMKIEFEKLKSEAKTAIVEIREIHEITRNVIDKISSTYKY